MTTLAAGQVLTVAPLHTCASLRIRATPGAYLRVWQGDEAGASYPVPASGVVEMACTSGIVNAAQYRLSGGVWDSRFGCPRCWFEVRDNVTYTMPAMEAYVGLGIVCGRVYRRGAVPAGGVTIMAVSFEEQRDVGRVAVTCASGYWQARVPPRGLGCDLWAAGYGERVPVRGIPYSETVLSGGWTPGQCRGVTCADQIAGA